MLHLQQAQADGDASHEAALEEFERRFTRTTRHTNVRQEEDRVQLDAQRYRRERDDARGEVRSLMSEANDARRELADAREENERLRAQLDAARANIEAQEAKPSLPYL